MKKAYTIPHHNLTYGDNKFIIEKAIKRLCNEYLINQDVMDPEDEIDLLQTIMNLTHIYFNMNLEE